MASSNSSSSSGPQEAMNECQVILNDPRPSWQHANERMPPLDAIPCICGKPINEAISVASAGKPSVTWSQKHTDFALVLKSGQELKCHKHVLAESSSMLESMLTHGLTETKTGQMRVDHLEDNTVYSFLEYLYAEKVTGIETLYHIRTSVGQGQYIYKRSFPKMKLTPDLLEVAHMYDVHDLLSDCAEYLRFTLCDHNVMERWLLGEKSEVAKLSTGAMQCLIKRESQIPIYHVPGFIAAFKSDDDHFKNLLITMSADNSNLREEAKEKEFEKQVLKRKHNKVKNAVKSKDKQIAELKAELDNEKKKIAVKVDKHAWAWDYHGGLWDCRLEWSTMFACEVTDTVQSLIDKIKTKHPLRNGDSYYLSKDDGNGKTKPTALVECMTFDSQEIVSDMTIYAYSEEEVGPLSTAFGSPIGSHYVPQTPPHQPTYYFHPWQN